MATSSLSRKLFRGDGANKTLNHIRSLAFTKPNCWSKKQLRLIFDLGEKTLGKICSQSQVFKSGGLFQAYRAYSFADILLMRG
jgi:hypothetical protein